MEEQQNLIDLLWLIHFSQCVSCFTTISPSTRPVGQAVLNTVWPGRRQTQWSPDLSTTFISGEQRASETASVCLIANACLILLTGLRLCVCV